MPSLIDEAEFSRICLFGEYGTGKTTALASAVNLGGRVHHLDAEKRLKASPIRRAGFDPALITPHRDFNLKDLSQLVWDVKAELHDSPGSVSAFGLDTVTELTKQGIRAIADRNLQAEKRKADKQGIVFTYTPGNVDLEWWNELTEIMTMWFRDLTALETNLVFLAHERREVDAAGVRIGPATSPAIQAALLAYVDIVGHIENDLGFRVARFAPGSKYVAKDTFGVLPGMMASPTVERIVRYVSGELTPDTDPVQREYVEAQEQAHARQREGAVADVSGSGRRRRSANGT